MTTPRKTILSIFPGIDLLGHAFELEGFHVLRGPDPIFGFPIEDFHPAPRHFEGIIGGPPCQDFSRARRCQPSGHGMSMLAEFTRVVTEAMPDWFLLENVIGVPDVTVPCYVMQRFNLNAKECGCKQNRPRRFQFGSLDGMPLVIVRQPFDVVSLQQCALASEGTRAGRRSWGDFCELQGLPRTFDLPGWTKEAKYRAVGNGVPIAMGRVLAIAVTRRGVTPKCQLCICECGRRCRGNQIMATAACRKRMERARRRSSIAGAVTSPV